MRQDLDREIDERQKMKLLYSRLVPADVRELLARLSHEGFEAYLVGGCVRDLLLHREPRDWDVATDAAPDDVMAVFSKTIPIGVEHGTVRVLTGDREVEVTTYRIESGYSDHRRPDGVSFAGNLEVDLSRRDFTVNALALGADGELVDCFDGIDDLQEGLLRTVGRAKDRFEEDALRMIRAVRFAAQLGFGIEGETYQAITENAPLLEHVSVERIRDEWTRAMLSDAPGYAMELFKETGLLAVFIPELLEGVDFSQNVHHRYNVWEHALIALEQTPPVIYLRLAALFHDVAKPRCLSIDEEGKRRFFHHEVVGAEMTEEILRRLRFDNQTIERVVHLVHHHLALHHYPNMSDAAVRRMIRRVGLDNLNDLIELRRADRIASGTKKGPISRGTQRLLERIETVLAEDAAFSLDDLAVDGYDVMEICEIDPGPLVGRILDVLLERVLEEPELNDSETLHGMIPEIAAEVRDEAG